MFEQTLDSNKKVRLATEYPLIAGKDPAGVPRLLAVDENGGLLLGGSGALPTWETFQLEYFGATNNLHRVTYRVGTDAVAIIELTYRGGGAADNDFLLTGTLTIP